MKTSSARNGKEVRMALIDKALGLPRNLKDYTYDDAIRLTQAALRTGDAAFLHFNLACFYSATNNITESLASLEDALQRGYNDWENIAHAPSLLNVRLTGEFWKIISRYFKDSESYLSKYD